MALTIYHNPRCSKSRQALAIIEAANITPKIVKYLDEPLTEIEILGLQSRLGFASVRDMMRRGEAVYKDMNLAQEHDEQILVSAMVMSPKLIERPIVDNGTKAIIGRPPEAVHTLL